MKRIIGILLCGVLLFALPFTGRSQSAALSSGDFQYEVSAEKTAMIIRYTGSAAELTIPATLAGYPVTGIGDNALRDCGSLQTVVISEGVINIGAQAFYNCTGLESVAFPGSLREIGDLAFAYCTNLKNVVIPEGTALIGEYAFGDCASLASAVVPASVTTIGPDAFSGTAAGFVIYGGQGSFAKEYAQLNGITFEEGYSPFPQTESAQAAETETVPVPDAVAEDIPETAPEDTEVVETPEDIVTATITVHFPHADRTGTYTGEMLSGLAHGEGTFTATNDEGLQWTYTGAWENGMMSGYGTMSWSDGLGYEGYYRENQPYEGQWLINSAVVYTGGFMMCPDCGKSVFHGAGQLTNRLGKLIFEGEFESGYLKETAEARMARAAALEPMCGRLTEDGYMAALQAADTPSGQLVKLEGRIGNVLVQDDYHGYTELILLNNGSGAYPIQVCYRYGVDEEEAEAGRAVTVWGAIVGVYRYTDKDGRAQAMPQVDADVISLSGETPQRGAAEFTLTASKVLDGRPLKNREFSFVINQTFTMIEERINPLDGSSTFVPVTYTQQLQTKGNDRDGAITFDPIRFTAADIGKTATYTVSEVPNLENGMTCDPMVMTVTAIITDNGNGAPAATVFYPDDIVFNNTYRATGEVVISASVTLEGRALKNGEFDFALMQADGTVLQTKRNDRNGIITFDPITCDQTAIGMTDTLTVSQITGAEEGMVYDPMVMEVSVSVQDAGNGALRVTAEYPDDTEFANIFTEPVPAFALLQVDVDKTSITEGGTVKWTPVVSSGTKPFSYHYRLMKDGAQYKDYGWVKDASKALKLSKAGVCQMEVTAKDAQGNLTQTVLSPQVTVKRAFSAKDLSGEWTGNHDYLVYTGSGTTDPLPQNYTCTMTLKIGSSGNGTISITFADFSGTATYKNGVFKATLKNKWCTDYYEGSLTIENGIMTLSGTLSETQESEHSYTGAFSFTKAQ